MTDKNKLLTLIPAAAGLLLAIGVMTVFSACGMKEDGTWMRCHEAQNYVAVCGVILTVLFAVSALVNNKAAAVICYAAALAVSVAAFLIPGNIVHMCMMSTMRCYTVFQPFTRIMAILCALLAGWGILKALKK